MSRQAANIEDALRAAIRSDGRTPYQLGKESGVDQTIITRFLRQERGIGLATAAHLCRVLGLHLVKIKHKG